MIKESGGTVQFQSQEVTSGFYNYAKIEGHMMVAKNSSLSEILNGKNTSLMKI